MADEEKKAKVTLDLGTTPAGYKFLDDLKGSLSKSAAFASDLKRQLAEASTATRQLNQNARSSPFANLGGGPAGSGGGIGMAQGGAGISARTGKSGGGFPSGLSGMIPGGIGGLARFAGPAALVAGGIAATQSTANYAHDPYMTSGQFGRSLFRDVVPFGSRIQSFVDSLTGRKFGMEQADIQGQISGLRYGGQAQIAAFGQQFNPARAGILERERLLRGASPVLMGQTDRTTAAGEREFREQSRLLPIRREVAKLEREAAVATRERGASESEVIKAAQRENDLIRQRAGLRRRIDADQGSGTDRQQLLRQFEAVNDAAKTAAEQRRSAEERIVQTRTREAEARGAARRGRAELSEATAANLEERAATAAGTARTLGGMNVFDRQFAVASLKAVQQFGTEAVHPEMLAAAEGIAPQTVGKLREAAGTRFAESAGLAGIAPADFAGHPEELRRQAQAARDQAERERFGAEQDVAAGTARAGERLAAAVVRAIDATVDAAIRDIDNKKRIERNAP